MDDSKFKIDKNYIATIAKAGEKINRQDPIVFALENDFLIEGENPIEWAVEKGIKIEDKNPIEWAVIHDKDIHWESAILSAITEDIKIENLHPIVWAVSCGKKIEGKDPIEWAIDKKIKIEGKDPIAWALDNGKKIGNKNPKEWFENEIISFLESLKAKFNEIDVRSSLSVSDISDVKEWFNSKNGFFACKGAEEIIYDIKNKLKQFEPVQTIFQFLVKFLSLPLIKLLFGTLYSDKIKKHIEIYDLRKTIKGKFTNILSENKKLFKQMEEREKQKDQPTISHYFVKFLSLPLIKSLFGALYSDNIKRHHIQQKQKEQPTTSIGVQSKKTEPPSAVRHPTPPPTKPSQPQQSFFVDELRKKQQQNRQQRGTKTNQPRI